jgi:hypothetical protein
MVKIAKGIKMPEKDSRGRNCKYPWETMKVGDSFLFPKTVLSSSNRSLVSISSKRYAPKSFVSRTTDKGLRCWRIK